MSKPCPSTSRDPRDPDPRPPDDKGNGDDNDCNNSKTGSVYTPVSKPGSEPKPEGTGKVLANALTWLVEYVDPDKQASLRITVKEPNQFNGSDQWKL